MDHRKNVGYCKIFRDSVSEIQLNGFVDSDCVIQRYLFLTVSSKTADTLLHFTFC